MLSAKFCLQAAEAGVPLAMYNLGIYYFTGYGVAKDYVLATTWLNKARISGDSLVLYKVTHLEELILYCQNSKLDPSVVLGDANLMMRSIDNEFHNSIKKSK